MDKVSVVTRKISTIINEHKIDKINFMKVEAEGYEPEILEGAKECFDRIHKIVVDGSPERHGYETASVAMDILLQNNFKVWRKQNMVYAINNQFN